MNKHTPGPWTAASAELLAYPKVRHSKYPLRIALFGANALTDDETAANIALAAAAPDMAEALRCAVDALSRLGYQDHCEHDAVNFAAMRAALAKAGL